MAFCSHSSFSRYAPLPLPKRGAYSRMEQLPGLIGLWPRELEDYSHPGTMKIAALLRKALRRERMRGRSGHWTYDLNRHMRLVEALKSERARLKVLERALPKKRMKATCAGTQSRTAGTLRLASSAGWAEATATRF